MEPVRIDLGLRLVVEVPSYRRAGVLMDDLYDAIVAVLNAPDDAVPGRFDFTHFNTRPCKAQRMQHFVEAAQLEMPGAVDGPL
jgi:hypothetical protein